MNDFPDIAPINNLRFYWKYRDENGKIVALVIRYDDLSGSKKKWFHQYRLLENGKWEEGAATPSPIFGLDSLSKHDSKQKVYIFEGEKCATAAHHLGLSALTSMMGSSQAQYADWAILAKFRHITEFVLVPDNDQTGKKYIEAVSAALAKACPQAKLSVCQLSYLNKGDDLVDWIKLQPSCPAEWNGFESIDEPYSAYLRLALEECVHQNLVDAGLYFEKKASQTITFENDPEIIQQELCDVLPCPVDTLPADFVVWIKSLAEEMQIQEDYLVATLFVALGSLIGRKRGLKLRKENRWFEHPNLWGLLIGSPSMMKSPAMSAVLGQLEALADNAAKAHSISFKAYEKDQELWKIRNKACEEVYKKTIKESLEDKLKPQPQASIKFHGEDCPIPPKKRRYKTNDSTTEKMGELLIENPQGLLLYRDEIAGWLNSFEKNGREGDRQFFLEGWSGKVSFDVDRIGRGSLHIPALCISILGSIQPGPLAQYVSSAVHGGCGDDGFIQRFQIIVWPDPKKTWELSKRCASPQIECSVQKSFERLNLLSFDPEGNPILLLFTDDAQNIFDQWQETLEKRTRSGDLPSHLEAHFSKYKKLLPALCLILEHLSQSVNEMNPQTVTALSLKVAIRWLDYFESHANRMYGSSANMVPKAANNLIERLRCGDIKEPFTARDVYHGKHWSGLSTPKQVEEVLEYLEEKNYLAGKAVKTPGRPTFKYWVNPKIFEENV
jgi:hypothetical protein